MFRVNNIIGERENSLYSSEHCRTLDRAAIEQGVPSFQLMARAARAVLAVLTREFSEMSLFRCSVARATTVLMAFLLPR